MGVARQLFELHDAAGRLEKAAFFAEAALTSMQGLLGVKVSACAHRMLLGHGRPVHASHVRQELKAMHLLLVRQVHPYLEPHFALAIRAKSKAGDSDGADALKRSFQKGMAQLMAAQQRAAAQQGRGGRGGKRR